MTKELWYNTLENPTPEEAELQDEMRWYLLDTWMEADSTPTRQELVNKGFDPDVRNEYARRSQLYWDFIDGHYDLTDKLTEACVRYKKRRALMIADRQDPGLVPEKIRPFLDLTNYADTADRQPTRQAAPQQPRQQSSRQQSAPRQQSSRQSNRQSRQNAAPRQAAAAHQEYAPLSVRERFALEKLCRRRYFEGTANWQRFFPLAEPILRLILRLEAYIIALITPQGAVILEAARTVLSVIYLLFSGYGLRSFAAIPTTIINDALLIALMAIYYDPARTRRALTFSSSSWWKNTHILPSAVAEDKGLYGEYMATLAAEENMKHFHLHGRVFNSVIVPTANGSFNEVDAVYVSEAGIVVIEAKGREGRLEGKLTDEVWLHSRNKREIENPLFQNQKHINALAQYLYPKFAGKLLGEKIGAPTTWMNTALFAIWNVIDNLDYSAAPANYFLGMTSDFPTRDMLCGANRILTPSEVDQICAELEALSGYTKPQLEQMIAERNARGKRGDFKAPRYYSVVNAVYTDPNTGNRINWRTLCWESCGDAFYRDPQDGWYHALPGCQVYNKVRCANEAHAFQMLRQSA